MFAFASEFHGALKDNVFSFFFARGGPLGVAEARVMADDDGYSRRLLMVLLFVSSVFRGDLGA